VHLFVCFEFNKSGITKLATIGYSDKVKNPVHDVGSYSDLIDTSIVKGPNRER
jgi:hypothetical protein